MWNPFRKKEQTSGEEIYNKVMEAILKKADETERPYRSTRIGFGAAFNDSTRI
jgi:hypothetical protein